MAWKSGCKGITFNPRFQGISIARIRRGKEDIFSQKALSIPVFRGSRLRDQGVEAEIRLQVLVFQSPFSGDLDCEYLILKNYAENEQIFQSPFSGDLDCE